MTMTDSTHSITNANILYQQQNHKQQMKSDINKQINHKTEVYGFMLYIITLLLVTYYCIILLIPIESSKLRLYWSVAIPTYIMVCCIAIPIIYSSYNKYHTLHLSNTNTLCDTFTVIAPSLCHEKYIPRIGDAHINHVNKRLHRTNTMN